MTDNSFPLVPPPDLIEDWIELAKPLPQRPPNPGELATFAARWGADQELEACCEWLDEVAFVYRQQIHNLLLFPDDTFLPRVDSSSF